MKQMTFDRSAVTDFREIGHRQHKVLTCEYVCKDCHRKESKEFNIHPWLDGDMVDSLVLNHAPWCMCVDDSKRVRFRLGSAYQRKHRLTKRVNP